MTTPKLTAQQEEYQKKIKEIIITYWNTEEGYVEKQETYQSELTPRQIFSQTNLLIEELKERYTAGDWEKNEEDPNCVACAWETGITAQTWSQMKSEDCEEDWTEYRRYESCAYPECYQEATILYATDDKTWFHIEGDTRTYMMNLTESKLFVRTPEGDFKQVITIKDAYQYKEWKRIARSRMREATQLLNAIK